MHAQLRIHHRSVVVGAAHAAGSDGVVHGLGLGADEGEQFLFQLGKPELIREACFSAAVGKWLPSDFYLHRSAEALLPALLQVLLFAERQIVGEITLEDTLKARVRHLEEEERRERVLPLTAVIPAWLRRRMPSMSDR